MIISRSSAEKNATSQHSINIDSLVTENSWSKSSTSYCSSVAKFRKGVVIFTLKWVKIFEKYLKIYLVQFFGKSPSTWNRQYLSHFGIVLTFLG